MTSCTRHRLPVAPGHLGPISPCMESISAIHFLIRSIFLYLFLFAFMSLCDLSAYDLFSIMSSRPPCLYVSASIPVSVCVTLIFLTRIYKPHMSCMSPQFVYQLQLDYYCHSLPTLNLSLRLSIFLASGHCLTLKPLPFDFMPNQKLFPQYPMTLRLPCNPWEVHTPAYI